MMCIFFIALGANGELRVFLGENASVPAVRLRIVQPDTPQSEKYVDRYLLRNWQRLIDLSNSPAAIAPTHIIWPEAAPPFQPLARFPAALDDIARLTGNTRVLLTGEVRVDEGGARTRYYNSFAMFGPHGKLLATSDKFHLVPFGEYLPFGDTLRSIGLSEIAANTGFSAGPGPETFSVPGAPPVGPLICYEVIFPNAVTANPRPAWLVNMTDDSWFGPNAFPDRTRARHRGGIADRSRCEQRHLRRDRSVRACGGETLSWVARSYRFKLADCPPATSICALW